MGRAWWAEMDGCCAWLGFDRGYDGEEKERGGSMVD